MLLVDHEVAEVLAGLVDRGALGAGAYARVDAEDARALERRGQEQVLEVLAEHRDAVTVGLVHGLGPYLAQYRRGDEPPEGVVDRLGVELVRYRVAGLEERRGVVLVDLEADVQLALALSAVDRQHAVRLEGVITSYSIHYTKLYEWTAG